MSPVFDDQFTRFDIAVDHPIGKPSSRCQTADDASFDGYFIDAPEISPLIFHLFFLIKD